MNLNVRSHWKAPQTTFSFIALWQENVSNQQADSSFATTGHSWLQEWADREKAADSRELQLKSKARELADLQETLEEEARALKSRRDGASSDLDEVHTMMPCADSCQQKPSKAMAI